MSKMTVKDDAKGKNEYLRLKEVEFVEFIGRIANIKYHCSQAEEMALSIKIEKVLDLLLPYFKLTRVEVEGTIDDCSSSDESCVFNNDESNDFPVLKFVNENK
jgi:hypothetical protein